MKTPIPFETFRLDNGLTVILHEDRKAPIVSVNIWYHVGSKNERPGKTGYAHLFEHLMFNGSENYTRDFFEPLEGVGVTDMNGTTDYDRTNYFANVPSPALDLLLWLESDRMGHFLGTLTQSKLDEQRSVVQNELKLYENQPYGKVDSIIASDTYPAGHPYSWDIGGSIDDLAAASLSDMQRWFSTYYNPANAVMVVAGDIEAGQAEKKAYDYFGHIPSQTPITRFREWIAPRSTFLKRILEDRVPFPRLYMVWNIPPWGSKEANHLELAARILGRGKSSRLYKRLVYQEQIAKDVSAHVNLREISGQFVIRVTTKPEISLQQVETILAEELNRFFREGPENEELLREQAQFHSDFLKNLERIGGFDGKSDLLASGMVYRGDPAYYMTIASQIREALGEDIRHSAEWWLKTGVYQLEVHPYPEYRTRSAVVDRSRLPGVSSYPPFEFPEIVEDECANGMRLKVCERHQLPLVHLCWHWNSGFSVDARTKSGRVNLTLSLIDEGTFLRSSMRLNEDLEKLGARFTTSVRLTHSQALLEVPKDQLEPALDIVAEMFREPAFAESEFIRLQKEQLNDIRQEKAVPEKIIQRIFPPYLYGAGHPYSQPFTASGYEESVKRLTRDDVVACYHDWFLNKTPTCIVAGDIEADEIRELLGKKFVTKMCGSDSENIPPKGGTYSPTIYLVDKPDAAQSMILTALLVPEKSHSDSYSLEVLNNLLGGMFTSRINMNLREEKGWTYGARSLIFPALGQRPLMIMTSVQTDKTAESIREIIREMEAIHSDRPVTREELERIKQYQILRLPGLWETSKRIVNTLSELDAFRLPLDYIRSYPRHIGALEPQDILAAAENYLLPGRLICVVVGDRNSLFRDLQKIDNFGIVELVNENTNAL